MKCKQCKYVKVCMAQADMLGQVFDVNYDGEHGCTDFTPFTNADRIRAMSDEELARIFTNFFVTVAEANNIPVVLDDNFELDHLDFLKEPAEEETT